MTNRSTMLVFVSLLLFASFACLQPAVAQSNSAGSHKAGDIVIEKTTLTTPETGAVQFELGTIYVPENRNDPKSRLIGLGFGRFRSPHPTGAPPQVHIPGGPGGSLLTRLKPDSKNLAATLKSYLQYSQASDVLIIDQRGYSERGDVLKFSRPMPAVPLDQPGSIARSTAAIVEATREAVKELTAKGVDLRGYDVRECADDVNDVRKALGYERIQLVATSFGSQWSFTIMRRHPDIVARALLSGVEPLDFGYDMPSHVLEAIQREWWEADKDPKLKPYLPKGGLAEAAEIVAKRLEHTPAHVTVTDKNGKTVTVALGLDDLQEDFLRLSAPTTLISLYYGHYDDWAKKVAGERQAPKTEGAIIRPSIDTSLGVTPRRYYLLLNDPAKFFLGHWNWDSDVATADVWPSEDVGDDFRSNFPSRVPVVFAQGDWDTSTPIENTLYTAPYFYHSRVLWTTHGRHGVLGPIEKNLPPVMDSLLEYLRTGSMENIPYTVTLPLPEYAKPDFEVPASGPPTK